MPTVNIFYTSDKHIVQLQQCSAQLKEHVATELSCKDIILTPDEVSIRLIKTLDGGMIADIEVEVTAHAFEERIQKQDEVANNIRKFLLPKIEANDIRVWLVLSQLGHSW